MKNFIHNFIFYIIPSFVFVICFIVIGSVSFGASASVSMGASASQTLSNGLSSVFDLSSISASPDPLGLSIGLSNIYDNLDLYLYQNYDYDLTGTINDTLEGKNDLVTGNIGVSSSLADSFINKMTDGMYQGVQELIGYGYGLYKCVTNSLSQAKDTFFIGKEQDGVITETVGGALTYVDESTLSMYESALTNSLVNNQILDVTNNKSFYGKVFNFSDGTHVFHLEFNSPVVLYSSFVSDIYYTCLFRPSGSAYVIPFSGFVIDNSTGFKSEFANNNYVNTVEQFNTTINDVNYIGRGLYINSLRLDVCSNYSLGNRDSVSSFVGEYNPYHASISSVYSLSPDIEAVIKELLGELKGHYVSTSDLDLLIDSLSNNGVISNDDVVVDGVTENVPVIDWSRDYIDTLEGILEVILENSDVYDDVLVDSNATTPDPPVNEREFFGTTIPDGFDTSSWGSVFDVFKVPFNFVSFFEPLFYVFGGFSGIFAIWSVVPFVFIIMLLIWALK